jgi:hypothetical protein
MFEAMSDEQGRFVIPWWGPRLPLPFFRMDERRNPHVGVFKAGHHSESLMGEREIETGARQVRLSAFRNSLDDRGRNARTFFASLADTPGMTDTTDWEAYPLTTAAMLEEADYLRAQGVDGALLPQLPEVEMMTKKQKALLGRE